MKEFFILIAILILSSTLYAAEPDPLWDNYIDAKIRFQNELADLLIESNPEFKDLIIVSRDLQVTMAKMRHQRYYYTLTNDPGRIKRDKGISQWSNFEWTEDDNRKLLATCAEYAELTRIKNYLQAKNQGNPDWPAAKKAFAPAMQTTEYQTILKKLMDTNANIDKELNNNSPEGAHSAPY